MKVCRRCGRMLRNGRWVLPGRGEVQRARRMDRLEMVTCPDCSRHPHAYSAVLQVRGFPRDELEELIIDRLVESRQKGELEKVSRHGGDYRFTSKSMARDVAGKLRRRGAELQETSKIVTYDRERSRQKTRLTIVARFRIAPGDVFDYRGRRYMAESVRNGFIKTAKGKKVRLKEAEKVPAERREGFYMSRDPPMVFLEDTKESIEVAEPGEGRVELVTSGGRTWVRKLEAGK